MNDHPYQDLENHPCWPILEQTLKDLVENQDLEETTHRHDIVGYQLAALAA